MAYRSALNWAASESLRRHHPLTDRDPPAPDGRRAEEELAALRQGLERLEPAERALLEGAYLEGLSYRDLAFRSGIAPGSVGPLLSRAKQRLAEILKKLS